MREHFAIFFRQLRRRLVRAVNGIQRHVIEKRPVPAACGNQALELAGEKIRGITVLADGFPVAVPVVETLAGLPVIRDQRAVETVMMIEAALERQLALIPVSEMPFANEGGVVSRLFEGFREGALIGQHARGIVAVGALLHAVPKGIPPGQESRARRRAHRMHVELREARPFPGEPVEIRSLGPAAVESGKMPVHVIGQQHHDVGLGILGVKGE